MKIIPKRKWRFPFGIERDYQRLLRTVAKELYHDTLNNIHLINSRLDESESEQIIEKIIESYNRTGNLNTVANQLKKYSEKANDWTRKEFYEVLSSAMKADIFAAEPDLRNILEEWIAENTRLIKSIPEQYHNQLQGIISRAITEGKAVKTVAGEVKMLYDVTNRRAQVIARDQIATINGQISKKRQQEAGIEEYIWSTSHDQRVRSSHRAREGRVFNWNEPPEDGHPGIPIRCRCVALPVIDTKDFPETKGKAILDKEPRIKSKELNSYLKTYTDEEIIEATNKAALIVSKHMNNESKWSGRIVFDNDQYPGKLWNCDIRVSHKTNLHMLIHEQLHAHSISYFGQKEYIKYGFIEESTVQFMTQEISNIEGIKIINSLYDDMVQALREINKVIAFGTDYEFARKLINIPLVDRYDQLENIVYAKMKKTGSLEVYQVIQEKLNIIERGITL